ncbi:Rad52/Rad22 family DNA repair protein [Massiliimalia massiliensis]|uniref:Rad52/Rad22 family DNA repair protein n=1 Tax=Massiliimalia massiliensis TaxID=1852384 RepID=UPI0009871F95|nr:Rad52/Rad22 family DNA repair protein [Massiliimalia massiliensis]
MTSEQVQRLEEPFAVHEIEWRVIQCSKDGTKGLVAAFVNSRAIQNRLDSVIGRENWQNNFIYIPGSIYNAKKDKDLGLMSCICMISIFHAEREEWISKSDGAGNTDIEPIKGGISNAFKRAASMWGVGRYLYEMPDIWVNLADGKFIAKTEWAKLKAHYNNFVAQYSQDRSIKNQISSTNQPNNTAANIRFSPKTSNVLRIEDMKVLNGSSDDPQTQLMLKMPNGEMIKGYIKGHAQLQKGQMIYNPKLTFKTAPEVGNYCIIEGYQMAA